jgi:hypothetical protein
VNQTLKFGLIHYVLELRTQKEPKKVDKKERGWERVRYKGSIVIAVSIEGMAQPHIIIEIIHVKHQTSDTILQNKIKNLTQEKENTRLHQKFTSFIQDLQQQLYFRLNRSLHHSTKQTRSQVNFLVALR